MSDFIWSAMDAATDPAEAEHLASMLDQSARDEEASRYRDDEEPELVEPGPDEPVDRCEICGDPNPNHFPPAPNVCFGCWKDRP